MTSEEQKYLDLLEVQLKEMEGEMKRERFRQACEVLTPAILLIVFVFVLLPLLVR